MIKLYVTGDGLLFWSLDDAQEHCDEIRDTVGDFISCECMNQVGIAENWEEHNEIVNNQ